MISLHLWSTLKSARRLLAAEKLWKPSVYPHETTKVNHQQKQGDIYHGHYISGGNENHHSSMLA
jgi:hypothetical protein